MPGTKGVPVHEPGQGVLRSLAIKQKQPMDHPQSTCSSYLFLHPAESCARIPDFHHPSFSQRRPSALPILRVPRFFIFLLGAFLQSLDQQPPTPCPSCLVPC